MRNYGLDLLRGLSAFFIVGCHLQLLDYTLCGSRLLHFCDMNVGVFAALAGYLMANSVSNVNNGGDWWRYVTKRAKRLLPIYFIWSAIFLLATAAFQIVMNGEVKPKYSSPHFWVSVVFWGSASTHLWFIASLFYAQCLLGGVLHKVLRPLWLGVSIALLAVSVGWESWYATYPIRLLSFLLLGYCLRGRLTECPLPILGIVLAAALLAHVFIPIPGYCKDWIAAGSIILFFTNLSVGSNWASFTGGTSMGVYLIHPLMTVGMAVAVKRLCSAPYGIAPTLTVWIGAWLLSLGLTVALQRIRSLQWLVR